MTNSQNMVDSIFSRQNDVFLLQCQVAQTSEYSEAKSLARDKEIFTVLFAILSVVASALDVDWLSATASFLAVVLAIFNKCSDEKIKRKKRHAASIQQYIDASLFAPAIDGSVSDWGDIPSKLDLAESVSKYGNQDTSAFRNWYSDYSSMTGESQVFYCQSENVRWDYDLHRRFKKLCRILLSIIVFAVVVALVVVNPNFVKGLLVLSWFIPVAEYGLSIIKELDESILLLRDADDCAKALEKKLDTSSLGTLRRDLIKLQYKIWKRRANGYMIPDWFYEYHKKNHQEKEDIIAKTIRNIDE